MSTIVRASSRPRLKAPLPKKKILYKEKGPSLIIKGPKSYENIYIYIYIYINDCALIYLLMILMKSKILIRLTN